MPILAQQTLLQSHTSASFSPICFDSVQNISLSGFKPTQKPVEAAGIQPLSKIQAPSETWFWSMKTGPSIHETPTRGITPTARKKSMSEIPFHPCWQQHYLTDFISLYVLIVWEGEEVKGKISLPRINSFLQHPDISLVPTTYGKRNRLSKLPGLCFGMQLKTNTQPRASATTSKSELPFVLYLYSRMHLRQHGNALPGSVRRCWDWESIPKCYCKPWSTAAHKSTQSLCTRLWNRSGTEMTARTPC